ncbi:hypothetical protein JOM56_014155, partial [Amanita muscaria]
FITSADQLYGPITTLRRDGRTFKKIPWTAFALADKDWERVLELKTILADSNEILHHFSSIKYPNIYRALPAFERLQTLWEKKLASHTFTLYHAAIRDGLEKLRKYYSKLDRKPTFILALVLHPYFKLEYIKMMWGGEEEQRAEQAKGNKDAKNWQDEAGQVVEQVMEKYWHSALSVTKPNDSEMPPQPASSDDETD